MTPQERQLVAELFDRLAKVEAAPRDRDAERAIADGLARSPNAIYPLVQTVLVQDEALKRADARIRELSGEDAGTTGGGFLDSMRDALSGRPAHGSVPSVRPVAASEPDPRWNSGGALAASQPAAAPPPPQGSSFLGTAAASAAGVIGGALLLNSISSMFGHHSGSAFADVPPASATGSPWSDNASNSDLARDAGLNDIGGSSTDPSGDHAAGLFDAGDTDVADLGGDMGGDSGGGDSA